MDLSAFAQEVGPPEAGPVTCVGGRTQWDVGGAVDPAAREVRAPSGVVGFEPAEMIVRCGAGTPIAELQAAVGEGGQFVVLPDVEGATVGGALAVGRSGLTTLAYGPMRDVLLEARVVTADGRLVKAGGPVVKNVSGFDLCRLLVGSVGTLAFLGEVVLRCRPRPAVSQWFTCEVDDPFALLARLHRPSSVLWDGTTTWVLLEGHPADVAAQAAGLREIGGPPPLPTGGRRSLRPGELRSCTGRFVAQLGVGVVHTGEPAPPRPLAPRVAALHRQLKARFDPTGRLNPGRMVAA